MIEGGRSRSDLRALTAVAASVERAGAQVKVLRHGLGRVSASAVRRDIRSHEPDLIVTTGATSTRDVETLARWRGVPVVCYYWPAGPVEDIHRRPRRSGEPRRAQRVSAPDHAVVGSPMQRQALRSYLGSGHAEVQIHVLLPLLEEAASCVPGQADLVAGHGIIGVYGGHNRELPSVQGCRYVDLDAAPAPGPAAAGAVSPELARLRECAAILLLGCDTAEELEAPRRCAVALVLGKPVLASGFGASGDELPLELPGLDAGAHGPLQAAAPAALPAALARWAKEQKQLAEAAQRAAAEALAPQRVLEQHVALLMQLATATALHSVEKPGGLATRFLVRLRGLLGRRSKR